MPPTRRTATTPRVEAGVETPDAKRQPVVPDAPIAKRVRMAALPEHHPSPGDTNNAPTIEAKLQYSKAGLGSKFNTKLLIKSNANGLPDTLAFVFCLDLSYSMGYRSNPGSGTSLLAACLRDFVVNGMPGKRVLMRFVMFGSEVEVTENKINSMPLIELNDNTRPLFLEIIDGKRDVMGQQQYILDGNRGQTNLHGAVNACIDLLKQYQDCTLQNATPIQHVVALTDGVANIGISDANDFAKFVKESIGWTDSYVHFVGLGSGVNETFMDKVTDKGKTGVFAVAGDAGSISKAYEDVFGFVADAAGSFDVCIRDANGTDIRRLGMLTRERQVLLDVEIPMSTIAGNFPVVHVSMAKNGAPIGTEIACHITYDSSVSGLSDEDADVRAKVQEERIEREREQIMMESADIDDARVKLHAASARYRDEGYDARAVHKAETDAMAVDEASESVQYRSLGGAKGARMLSVAMSSSQAY